MEEITDFVVKVLIILGGLGLLFGAFFMFELLFRNQLCH